MAGEAIVPNAAVVEPVRRSDIREMSNDDLANDVMSALADETFATKPPKGPKKRAEQEPEYEEPVERIRKQPDSVDEPGDEEDESDPEDEGDYDGGEAPEDADVDDSAHEAKPTIGTREKPYPAKDLPTDRFVQLKIDGEEVVVDFAECARGYIGWAATTKRLNAAKDLTAKAEQVITEANEFRQGISQQLNELFDKPEKLYEYLLERDEGILEQVGRLYATRLTKFREKPELLLQDRQLRQEAKLRAEREQFAEEQRQAQEQRQRQEVMAERARIFQPGWADGLKRAGFPELTKQSQDDLYQEVILRCNQRHQAGLQVTSKDVSDFVTRACKLLELKPKGQASAPPVVRRPPPRAPAAPARSNGNGKSFSKNDPDSFLKGLNVREFRR